jgi:hypothetical protein
MFSVMKGVHISSISICLVGRTRVAIDDHTGSNLIGSDVEQHLLQIVLNLDD